MKAIQSAANAEFKRWRRLAGNPRFMKTQGRTLAEGLHLAQAILDAGHPVAAALPAPASRHVLGASTRRGSTNWPRRCSMRSHPWNTAAD